MNVLYSPSPTVVYLSYDSDENNQSITESDYDGVSQAHRPFAVPLSIGNDALIAVVVAFLGLGHSIRH